MYRIIVRSNRSGLALWTSIYPDELWGLAQDEFDKKQNEYGHNYSVSFEHGIGYPVGYQICSDSVCVLPGYDPVNILPKNNDNRQRTFEIMPNYIVDIERGINSKLEEYSMRDKNDGFMFWDESKKFPFASIDDAKWEDSDEVCLTSTDGYPT